MSLTASPAVRVKASIRPLGANAGLLSPMIVGEGSVKDRISPVSTEMIEILEGPPADCLSATANQSDFGDQAR
jgi:hypothetical protein